MTTIHRAQVVLAHKSGLPRDAVVNTFHIAGLTTPVEVEAAAEKVRDFYTVDPVAAGHPVLSEVIGSQIANTGHQVRMYAIDLETGVGAAYEGAPPVHIEPFDFVGRTTPVESHPSEVAICVSMRNTTAVAIPAGRRRGRVFIGPVERLLSTDVGGDGVPRVHPNMRAALLASASKLRADLTAAGGMLVIYSRPFAGRFGAVKDNGDPKPDLPARVGSALEVEQFSVDNVFDTIRRRGETSTAREFSS